VAAIATRQEEAVEPLGLSPFSQPHRRNGDCPPLGVASSRAAIAALLLLSFPPASRAGAADLRPQLSAATVTVGDLLTYAVDVPLAPDESITGPRDQAKLDPWEVRGYREEPGSGVVRVVYALTAFETGEQAIPSLEIRITDARGKMRVVRTAPVKVAVTSVLKKEDQNPADIVGPLAIREKPGAVVVRALIVGLALLAVAAAVWFLIRRRRRRAAGKPKVIEPPDVIALRALSRLKTAGLVERGKVKAFYTELSDILREYVAARYGVRTLEETTSRIVAALRKHWQAADDVARFGDLLREADVVKFAKARPDEVACFTALDAASALVRDTAAPRFAAEG